MIFHRKQIEESGKSGKCLPFIIPENAFKFLPIMACLLHLHKAFKHIHPSAIRADINSDINFPVMAKDNISTVRLTQYINTLNKHKGNGRI